MHCRTVAILILSSRICFGSDTGHHSDLTREALRAEGFQDNAIKVVQVENWLTDYYSNSPTSPDQLKAALDLLHFDNLFSTEAIRNYTGKLILNTKAAAQQAATAGDQLKLLTVLGVSLHAIQDFYSHSNWAETHPRAAGGPFRTETFFTSPPGVGEASLHTGSYPDRKPGAIALHGDYFSGLNKDSYVRPNWQEAYVFAYAASRQWVRAVRGWVQEINASVWDGVRSYNENAGLARDLEAAYRLSEWVEGQGADGHWKGNRSGNLAEFLAYAVQWTTSPDSQFVHQFKLQGIPLVLSAGLADSTAPPSSPPVVEDTPLNVTVIILQTLQVKEDEVGFLEPKIDPGGSADFFAEITIADQTFVEAMQLNRSSVDPSWTSIKFVASGAASVPIVYRLWDEDGGVAGDDDHCDIKPGPGRDLNFTFNVGSHDCGGDISGVHDTPASAKESKGSGGSDRAIVRFFVTSLAVQE
jgi:hypothetical protein